MCIRSFSDSYTEIDRRVADKRSRKIRIYRDPCGGAFVVVRVNVESLQMVMTASYLTIYTSRSIKTVYKSLNGYHEGIRRQPIVMVPDPLCCTLIWFKSCSTDHYRNYGFWLKQFGCRVLRYLWKDAFIVIIMTLLTRRGVHVFSVIDFICQSRYS